MAKTIHVLEGHEVVFDIVYFQKKAINKLYQRMCMVQSNCKRTSKAINCWYNLVTDLGKHHCMDSLNKISLKDLI